MGELVRFGVALEKTLLKDFDAYVKGRKYPNRSKAIADLVRSELVKKEWSTGKEVAGVICLVYDHHKRELVNNLIDIQHDFHGHIVSTQHIHLDHNNCLEMVVAKGKPDLVKDLANRLQAQKGVKFGALTMATTGKKL